MLLEHNHRHNEEKSCSRQVGHQVDKKACTLLQQIQWKAGMLVKLQWCCTRVDMRPDDSKSPHPSASLQLQEIRNVPLYDEHILAHPVEHHHVERDPEHSEEHTEDLSSCGAGTDVPITCKTVNC